MIAPTTPAFADPTWHERLGVGGSLVRISRTRSSRSNLTAARPQCSHTIRVSFGSGRFHLLRGRLPFVGSEWLGCMAEDARGWTGDTTEAAGASAQSRYDRLAARDAEARRRSRTRSIVIVVASTMGAGVVVLVGAQLANHVYRNWQSSLPGYRANPLDLVSTRVAVVLAVLAMAGTGVSLVSPASCNGPGFRQVHGTTRGGVDVGGVMLAAGGGVGQVVRVGFCRLR